MRILCLLLIIHAAFAQTGFGTSYLKNSKLCHEWNCVNSKLGLGDSLPAVEDYSKVLKALLPAGAWRDIVDKVLDVCYTNRPRRYTNTCPGQALLHCTLDQLINFCPEENVRKDDACAPINSLAGFKYMFTQSRYDNLKENIPLERRPSWFLNNYFSSKCCNLPPLIGSSLLSECGFNTMLQIYSHTPKVNEEGVTLTPKISTSSALPIASNHKEMIKVVDFGTTETPDVPQEPQDPFDCCDMSDFIKPSWIAECGFELRWEGLNRLVISNRTIATSTEAPVATSTVETVKHRDFMVVPQTCEKETCVFKKLNIVSETGAVDIEAFSKFLDNFTNFNPEWNKAKARVATTCLRKPFKDYESDCNINKVLACTLDVLTENCPYIDKKHDMCKHSKNATSCHISSSKYRPKNRRVTCALPELVNKDLLAECGVTSLSRIERAADTPVSATPRLSLLNSKYKCLDLTPSTACVMKKMNVLNKYGFMDYFIMKDKIRQFTQSHEEWSRLLEVYLSAFNNIPMYREHCNSPKKFLNLIDSMLMTCPMSRRKNTPQCAKLIHDVANTAPMNQNTSMTQEKIDQIMKHFHHVFVQPATLSARTNRLQLPPYTSKTVKQPYYNFGILNSNSAPSVRIIDVKPKVTTAAPVPKPSLVLLPVYMRVPQTNIAFRPLHNDGIMRSFKPVANGGMATPFRPISPGVVYRTSPFWLHNKIAAAHNNFNFTLTSRAPIPMVHTQASTTPVSANVTQTRTEVVKP